MSILTYTEDGKGPVGIDMGNTTVDVTGVRIPLIALDDLIETKRTGRLQDAADIEALEEIRRFHRKSLCRGLVPPVAFCLELNLCW